MSTALALTTLGIVLLLELIRRWRIRQQRSCQGAGVQNMEPAAQGKFHFHAGHSWILAENTDLVSVGVDDFAARFVGRIDSVEIKKPGSLVQQGEPLVTLRHGSRSLVIASPLSGILWDVNSRLSLNPALINESPYEKGWIARLSPTRLQIDLRNLVSPALARRWRQGALEKLMLRFPRRLGTVLQDGGQLSDSIGDLLGDEDWELLVNILFPLRTVSLPAISRGFTE
jgi:glycine cleavage system H protein